MVPTDDGQRKVCLESSMDGKYCFTAEDPSRSGGRGRGGGGHGRVEITCHVCTKDTGNEDQEGWSIEESGELSIDKSRMVSSGNYLSS